MDAEALVFVVDDDASLRASLQDLLESVGLRVAACASAQEFLRRARPEVLSCLVLDVRLPGLSGLDLQKQMAEGDRDMPIIFITGHGDIPMTVQAMKAGAVEFLTKPFRDQDLRLCRKFFSGGREGVVAPVGGVIRRPGSRTVRPP
jgi:FixJ family two-component response regulator